MFTRTRTKTVTEKSFDDRNDNFIIATEEIVTNHFLGFKFRTRITKENLVSIPAEEPEQKSVSKKKKIGFNVE